MKQILDFREQQGEYLGYDQISEQKCKNFRCKGDLRYWVLGAFSKKILFSGVKEFFFVYYDFKNGCKNEFEDNNEKSCSWFKNKVPQKIDFRADGTHESHPTAWELIEKVNKYQKHCPSGTKWTARNPDLMIMIFRTRAR